MSLQSEALRYWRMGQYDTVHIAEKLNASEAEVYAAIATRIDPPAPRVPRPPRAPKPIIKRLHRFAGFDQTERQIS